VLCLLLANAAWLGSAWGWGAQAAAVLENEFVRLQLSDTGQLLSLVDKASGRDYAGLVPGHPVFDCRRGERVLHPISVLQEGGRLAVRFPEGVEARIALRAHGRFFTFELSELTGPEVDQFTLCGVATSIERHRVWIIGGAYDDEFAVCVQAITPNVDQTCSALDGGGTLLSATCYRKYGLVGAKAALIACPRSELRRTIPEMEAAVGLPSARWDGVWAKDSPRVKRSYLFAIGFGEKDCDDLIRFAKMGNFDMVMFGHGTWCTTAGHYPINTALFPDGIASLKRVVARLHAAGLRAGMHIMAPSIAVDDAYVRPAPDPRLVKDLRLTLAEPLSETADRIVTTEPPTDWPAEDGGYFGKGTVIQIGDELVSYSRLSQERPFGFTSCTRGYHGTKPAAHPAGEAVAHLKRSYGYFLYDADSSLADEVVENVAKTYNECRFDMIYFDACEALQGDWWYYVNKIQKSFYDRLYNKDRLHAQGSSTTPWTWHFIPRTASADGFADIKTYLDQRAADFSDEQYKWLGLEVGWYSLNPRNSLSDMEYVVGKSVGFDACVSIEAGPEVCRTGYGQRILRMIGDYERLRVGGRFSNAQKAALRRLGREFRLAERDGRPVIVPATHEPAHRVTGPEDCAWTVHLDRAAQLQLEVQVGDLVAPGAEYTGERQSVLEDFEAETLGVRDGATMEGVTQEVSVDREHVKVGMQSLRYTAANAGEGPGWSMSGRTLDPPLDLSACVGLGAWVYGDGKGELLKIQLRDTSDHYQDHYLPITFTGWRYWQMVRPDATEFDYANVQNVNLYYNEIPAKTTVTTYLDDIKALRSLAAGSLHGLELRIGDQPLVVSGRLERGEVWDYRGPEHSFRYRNDGGMERAVVRGQLANAGPGDVPVRVILSGETPLTHELIVRIAKVMPDRGIH
jgi:hypothetical protein